MTQIFRMILSLSVSGGLVGLLILLLRPVTRRYFARKWTYYLWLLVLVRLMVPVHVDANVMEYLSGKLAVAVSRQEKVNGSGAMSGEVFGNEADGLNPDESEVSGRAGIVSEEGEEKGTAGIQTNAMSESEINGNLRGTFHTAFFSPWRV